MTKIKMENTIDYKLGQISSDIGSLKKMHEDEKHLREENHSKLSEINERTIKLDDAMLRIESWKDGQTIYMHETTERITKLEVRVENYKDGFERRLTPLESYLGEVNSDKKDFRSRNKDTFYSILKGLGISFATAVVISYKSILVAFYNILTR